MVVVLPELGERRRLRWNDLAALSGCSGLGVDVEVVGG